MAPIAFFFAASGAEIVGHDLLISVLNLPGYCLYVFRCYHKFFAVIFTIAYGFNKIKNGADYLPVGSAVMVYQYFIKNGLPPVIAPVWRIIGWAFL